MRRAVTSIMDEFHQSARFSASAGFETRTIRRSPAGPVRRAC